MDSLLQLLVCLRKADHQVRRVLPVPGVEGSQGGRGQFSDEPTEPVVEDASAQALDADNVFLEVGGKPIQAAWLRPMASLLLGLDGLIVEGDHHPQQVGDRVLEGEKGIAREDIACVLPGELSLDQAGFPFPISDQLQLPQRHATNDGPAKHHTDEAQYRLPHPLPPRLRAPNTHHARLQPSLE
jgi:hypothetical protein